MILDFKKQNYMANVEHDVLIGVDSYMYENVKNVGHYLKCSPIL